RVRAEAGAVVGLGAAGHREIDKAQGVLVLQNSAVAAHAGAVLQRREVVVGALDLGVAHAVANEQKDVFGRGGRGLGRGFRLAAGRRRRGGGAGGGGSAGRRAARRQAQGQAGRAQQGHGAFGQVFHFPLSLIKHIGIWDVLCCRKGKAVGSPQHHLL